jgi:hypothetical protein
MRDIFEVIRRAADRGKGVRLSADEVALLAQDYAICMGPAQFAADEAEREKDRKLRELDKGRL